MRESRCLFARTVAELPAQQRENVDAWLTAGTNTHGTTVSAAAVSRALHADGHNVGVHTIRDHKRGACACASR